jgi:hypothetical protein
MGPIVRIPRQPGRRGCAGQFIQNIATGRHWPAPTATLPQQRMMIAPRPGTLQLCSHCRQRRAGSWASHATGQTVRRPWHLSRCQGLDPGRYQVIPFDGHTGAGRWP